MTNAKMKMFSRNTGERYINQIGDKVRINIETLCVFM